PTPRLGIVLSRGNAATDSFVRIKAKAAEKLGVELVREELSENATAADAVAAVERLSKDCDGVIVQLPLSPSIDAEAVISAVPHELDVDRLNADGGAALAPVAGAMLEILDRHRVEIRGKKAIVIGKGRLVGRPCTSALRERGAHVEVLTEGDSLDALADADIVVSGAGESGLIKPDMIKDDVVLIDAGTSEQGGKLAGDADPQCALKASVFTPVPGGVGPVAIAMIFKNLFALMEAKK
ncbi:MAG TPA: bifunctional 5,10-methylenetetrahydrofolate dehydrogenase/5,10-methenyltetrahydrofolate cyclohydrolase, partial [Candidatus Paceibacterota bacterium]